jgi:thioredoxin-related protein
MTTRRQFLVGSAAALVTASVRAEEPILTEDGLYRQPWYLDSLLELADDLAGAAQAGKRLAVMWELRGCPYCKEMHLVNFARPDIADYVKSRFDILQLNIRGDRLVTDFDGEQLAEKRLAAKYQVRFTPTVQFFPDSLAALAGKPADKREVFRIPGYLRPDDFLGVFRYVAERGYERGSLRDFLRQQG